MVLSASMSTLSSLVLTSASALTLDVILPAKKNEVTEKTKINTMRWFILFFIVLSAVIAVLKDSIWKDFVFIAQMMGVSWGALAGSFLAPFLYGLYWKKATKTAVGVNFAVGVSMMLFQLLVSMKIVTLSGGVLGFVFQNPLYSGVAAMLLGMIIVPVVSLLSQKNVPADVEEKFAGYNKQVTVSVKDNLG